MKTDQDDRNVRVEDSPLEMEVETFILESHSHDMFQQNFSILT